MKRMIPTRMMAGAALLAGVLAPLGGILAAPAAADEVNALTISLDGESFSESPEGSLFPSDVALVPGASTSTTIHVRNESSVASELRLAVTGANSANTVFLESLSMRASTAASAGAPVPLQAGDRCSTLLSEPLEAGATATVTITLLLADSVGNTEQRSTAGADLHVSLREPGAPDLADGECGSGTGIPVTAEPDEPTDAARPDTEPAFGGLPTTGLDVGLSPWIGVSALVVGTVIFLISRHRKRLEEE